ncbi:hypothetical protein JNB_02000 [Janibacter sp. HTCC2649]|uniref:hypothetical protein n=1 Tax=Janibacter sp. HTCC2649 TaxID=313589 RepID=UPI000066EB62|nr:hypothetical protein [Janibacter sp. HTCC2649]EAP98902.1 hypothetical protein JNB_02000 [Janibacter sp. HTCC2649]
MRSVRTFLAPSLPLARVAWMRRFIYAFVWLDVLWIVTDPIPHGDVPASLYRGLSVRSLLGMPAPSHTYVRVLLALILISSLCAALGRLPRLAGWVTAIGMLDWVSNAFAYSKVDHDHFALIVALFVLPTVGRASIRDVEVRSEAAGWAIRMIQIGAVSVYALSAWAKMRFGGWGWANGATLIWALTRRPNGIGPWVGSHPSLTHALQWIVLVAEFCAPIMLWLRGKALYVALSFWAGFHLSTYLMLKIHFLPLAVCLLAFLPLERIGSVADRLALVRSRRARVSTQVAE